MKSTLVTAHDYRDAVQEMAGRGVVTQMNCFTVEIRVPFWRIWKVRDETGWRKTILTAVIVRPLSFVQHFTLWRVKVRSK